MGAQDLDVSQNRLGLFGADSLGATLTGARTCGALGFRVGFGFRVGRFGVLGARRYVPETPISLN